MHLRQVHAGKLGGDEDLVAAEADDSAARQERATTEASSVVVNAAQRAKLLSEAANHTLAETDDGSRPDENSSQRRCWPHGGHQLSWWSHGRS